MPQPNEYLMIYYPNKKATLAEKVLLAAAQYHKKYSTMPAVCLVNPNECPEKNTVKNDAYTIQVEPDNYTAPNYYRVACGKDESRAVFHQNIPANPNPLPF